MWSVPLLFDTLKSGNAGSVAETPQGETVSRRSAPTTICHHECGLVGRIAVPSGNREGFAL
ncbi:MAG: hypothetical protein RL535_1512 [Pseudomonadota bacterium]